MRATHENSMRVPDRSVGRNALTVEGGPPYGIRVRIEYPADLERYGSQRILEIAGEMMSKLKAAAETSDPASPHFEYPADGI